MGETMLNCFQNAGCTPNPTSSGTFPSLALHADTLKYAFTDGLGYDRRQLVSNVGAALMTKEKTAKLYNDC